MATRICLGRTRYRSWTGIFEAMHFFKTIHSIPHPSPDPRVYMQTGPGEPLTRVLRSPSQGTMMRLNRLAKSIWLFVKSIRIFCRTAIAFRASGDPEALPNDFWILCPPVTYGVFTYLSDILTEGFGIRCFDIDQYGNHPPLVHDDDQMVGFVANLLDDGVSSVGYVFQRHLMMDIYMWMFNGNREMINELVRFGELVDPPMVSYAFPIAIPFEELLETGISPPINPADGDDLGDID